MIIINKPDNFAEVQCYKCKTIMKAHPMSNMYADYFSKCEIHKNNCAHEPEPTGGEQFMYQKCRLCGEFYR